MGIEQQLTVKETADLLREMIQHEDEIVNQRMTWFLTIQGLLFAALSFGWDNDVWLVAGVLAPAGLAVCVFSRSTLVVGPSAVGDLVRWWDAQKPANYFGPDIVGRRVETSGIRQLLWPWNSLPLTLGLFWFTAVISRVVAGP
jgi:hypothetical protein